MTVFWYVNDLKVSHGESKEVTNFMEWIDGIYGELIIGFTRIHNRDKNETSIQ